MGLAGSCCWVYGVRTRALPSKCHTAEHGLQLAVWVLLMWPLALQGQQLQLANSWQAAQCMHGMPDNLVLHNVTTWRPGMHARL